MTLRHYEIFIEVCRQNSITAAAAKLNMSQPAVSIAVRELEDFYKVKLFERMNRRIYITEAGQKLLRYAGTVMSQLDEAAHALKNEPESGHVRIGVNVAFAGSVLPGIMRRMRQEHPNIDLRVFINSLDTIEAMLDYNEIDFAIVDARKDTPPNRNIIPLFQERMTIVCSPEFPKKTMSLSEFAHQPLLLREVGSENRNSISSVFARQQLVCTPLLESISSFSIIRMAEYGIGYAILPRAFVAEQLASGTLCEVTLTDATFDRSYYLVWHKNKYLTASTQVVMQLFHDACMNRDTL